jgi:hypothetical protein
MRPIAFHAQTLVGFFKRQKIATLPEIKDVLGTAVNSTVFRKLKELAYRSSYSHRGRYYTLDEIARFDALGLWSFREVWFSRAGTLISTAAALVEGSEAGYRADELESLLHVDVKVPLLKLTRDERLVREQVSGRYLYVSGEVSVRKQQMAARQVYEAEPSRLALPGTAVLPDELKAAIILFFGILNEKERRLYAGLEALKVGHGGDQRIAELLGLDPGTVARGRQELLRRDIETARVRKTGAGRKRLEKKRQT